jgi:hypothetical protein
MKLLFQTCNNLTIKCTDSGNTNTLERRLSESRLSELPINRITTTKECGFCLHSLSQPTRSLCLSIPVSSKPHMSVYSVTFCFIFNPHFKSFLVSIIIIVQYIIIVFFLDKNLIQLSEISIIRIFVTS